MIQGLQICGKWMLPCSQEQPHSQQNNPLVLAHWGAASARVKSICPQLGPSQTLATQSCVTCQCSHYHCGGRSHPELVHAQLPGRIQFAQSSPTSPADAGQLSSFWHFRSYYIRVASRQKGHSQEAWHHGNHYLACTTWPKPSDLSVTFESGSPPPCPKAPRTSLELLVVE